MRVDGIMATLADLPDSVLLEIFSYLPVRDRIRLSRVCHRWKRLVDDRWLWRHVDLTLYTALSSVLGHRSEPNRQDPRRRWGDKQSLQAVTGIRDENVSFMTDTNRIGASGFTMRPQWVF
uniref:F-box and leucine rich repeat protein 12 n=1 Tax=Rousettus aegyptiacus TaxID=9407 RepID=A0A7J8BRA8_ROUAE|nr:F-box and leucine rich repeat protein 12 [Rousettus aegyptiacus]